MNKKKRKYDTLRIHTFATAILIVLQAVTGCSQFCNSNDCGPETTASKQEQSDYQGHSLTNDQEAKVSTENQPGETLPVASIVVQNDTLMASVISYGCTQAEDFHIDYQYREHDGSITCKVTLVRDKPDYCRRSPAWVSVSLPWQPPDNCDNVPVEFTNPVVDSETVKHPWPDLGKLPEK